MQFCIVYEGDTDRVSGPFVSIEKARRVYSPPQRLFKLGKRGSVYIAEMLDGKVGARVEELAAKE